jgi:hypothetical protein
MKEFASCWLAAWFNLLPRRRRQCLPPKYRQSFYQTLQRPIPEYGALRWVDVWESILDKLSATAEVQMLLRWERLCSEVIKFLQPSIIKVSPVNEQALYKYMWLGNCESDTEQFASWNRSSELWVLTISVLFEEATTGDVMQRNICIYSRST